MADGTDLFLHEQIMLLALRDEKGTLASGTMYSYGLAGAILSELMLAGRIDVVTPKKTPLVEFKNGGRMNDPILDEALEKIQNAKRRASLQTWVGRLISIKRLRHRIAERLALKGILRVDEDKVLLLFTRKLYPERDGRPEKQILSQIDKAIFGGIDEVDPRLVTLIALAHHTGLLKANFDKKKLKAHKKRIEQIMNGDLTALATRKAIEAMQTAVIVACVMPAIITTVTASH